MALADGWTEPDMSARPQRESDQANWIAIEPSLQRFLSDGIVNLTIKTRRSRSGYPNRRNRAGRHAMSSSTKGRVAACQWKNACVALKIRELAEKGATDKPSLRGGVRAIASQ
jgi:hypothetical protein